MRIHRLEIEAFGPFAQRQVIDFDELGAQGLFLLIGPTGAGKTSILDAICYALYGQVPGARQQAKRLRSDHADQVTAPEVVLEFSSGNRRLEVVRNPQWERPARRAGGKATVTEQARTLLRERRGGQWVQKSARNDEAAAEIQDLLGMNKEQFTRVVLLPQGEFAAFLRADATDRATLLQKLFGTDRFEQVEEQLRRDAADAEAAEAAQRQELDHVLRRAADEMLRHGPDTADTDAAGTATAAGSGDAPAASAADPASEASAVEGIARAEEQLRGRLKTAEQDLSEAENRLSEAETARAALLRRRELGLEHARLLEDQAALEEEAGKLAPLRAALEAHGQASALAGLLQAWQGAADSAERSEAAAVGALEALAVKLQDPRHEFEALPEAPDRVPEALADLDHRLGIQLGSARAGLADEERAEALDAEAAAAEEEAAARAASAEAADAGGLSLRAELQETEARIERLRASAAAEEALAGEVGRAEALLRAIDEYQTVSGQAAAAADRTAELRDAYQDRREEWQAAVARRLEQAAADLAAGLQDGTACPVCGAEEHPHPAALPPGTKPVGRREEERLREAVAEAEARWEAARREAEALALRAEALRAQGADTDADAAAEELGRLRTELAAAGRDAREQQALQQRREQLAGDIDALSRTGQEARVAEAAALARAREAARRSRELAERTLALRGGFDTLAGRVAFLGTLQGLVGEARTALADAASCRTRTGETAAALETALARTSFADAAAARAALLDEDRAAALAERIARHAEQRQRLSLRAETLAEEEYDPARPVPGPEDVAEAEEGVASLRRICREAALRVQRLRDSADVLAGYIVEARSVSARLRPLAERSELLRSVRDTARGGGDNHYRMTLSTYVLAARLEQVAEAATERLATMTGGRYALVHSDAKAGNRKAGLGLHVVDGWTGQRRDTATLSGGESFMASLALALGLADVVQQEAGGVSIETLFVDEGFGSLDEQSLEQVMDALEGLRDGGRMVGLVSHVAEMKQRIPAQLQVVKGQRGSRVVFAAPAPEEAGFR